MSRRLGNRELPDSNLHTDLIVLVPILYHNVFMIQSSLRTEWVAPMGHWFLIILVVPNKHVKKSIKKVIALIRKMMK